MTGSTLLLRDGSVADITSVAGLHLVGQYSLEGVVTFSVIDESDAVDCDQFRQIWRELGGSAVDSNGMDVYS